MVKIGRQNRRAMHAMRFLSARCVDVFFHASTVVPRATAGPYTIAESMSDQPVFCKKIALHGFPLHE